MLFSILFSFNYKSVKLLNGNKKPDIVSIKKLTHDSIIKIHCDSLVSWLGEEDALGVIRLHTRIELDNIRFNHLQHGRADTNSLSYIYFMHFNLDSLKFDSTLTKIAQDYAKEMHDNDRYSHICKYGSDPGLRIALKMGTKHKWAENINIASNIKWAIFSWENSQKHFNTIKTLEYDFVGIGYYRRYWVNDFIKLH
jgi:hypothetical protein